MIAGITQYFAKERDEEPGDLAAGMAIDFITEKPARVFADRECKIPYRFMKEAAEDMPGIRRWGGVDERGPKAGAVLPMNEYLFVTIQPGK